MKRFIFWLIVLPISFSSCSHKLPCLEIDIQDEIEVDSVASGLESHHIHSVKMEISGEISEDMIVSGFTLSEGKIDTSFVSDYYSSTFSVFVENSKMGKGNLMICATLYE